MLMDICAINKLFLRLYKISKKQEVLTHQFTLQLNVITWKLECLKMLKVIVEERKKKLLLTVPVKLSIVIMFQMILLEVNQLIT